MTEDEIFVAIGELALRHFGRQEPLAFGDRLVEDLELDSLRLWTLAVEVEDRFQICLDDEDEARIVTVGDLVATVARKLSDDR